MGICLDEDCQFQNREKARFCARCGLPLPGSLLQGRYEIQQLESKERGIVTLQAIDQHSDSPVKVRALHPQQTGAGDQESFLQDAELAVVLSSRVAEPGSIHVTDYGQDGPVAFLIKSEVAQTPPGDTQPQMTVRVAGERKSTGVSPAATIDSEEVDEDSVTTRVRRVIVAAPATPIPAAGNEEGHRMVAPSSTGISWEIARANQAYEQGNYEEARVAYEQATRLDANTVEAWSGLGTSLIHLGYAEEALRAYDTALSLRFNDPELWTSKAQVLHLLDRYDEEMQCYDKALSIDPNYVFAWSGRGMTLAEIGRVDEALLAFDRALTLDPKQSVIWQAMSDTLYSMQRYDEALLAVERAIELDSSNAALLDLKGNIHRRLRHPAEALALHERATLLEPQNSLFWFDKANDLRDLRRYAEALAAYDHTLTLDPALAGAWYNRGNVLAALRMYEEALESYDHALEYDDGLSSAWYNKGSLLHEFRASSAGYRSVRSGAGHRCALYRSLE